MTAYAAGTIRVACAGGIERYIVSIPLEAFAVGMTFNTFSPVVVVIRGHRFTNRLY